MAATTTLEDRIHIMESSEAGESAWRIARRLRWRPSTIRKWRNRGRKLGRQGLVTRMGRPKTGALGSYSKEMRDILLRWHQEHPGWGPGTLKAELVQHETLSNEQCPSRASIGRFLREQGLTKTYEPHSEAPHPAGRYWQRKELTRVMLRAAEASRATGEAETLR